MLPLHRLTFWLWFVVTPHLIACIGSVGPDKVTVFIQCSFRCCISICETHLVQTLWYCSVATVVSNALKLAFSSMVVIWWFAYMGWLRHPSFHLWMVIWNMTCLSCLWCHCWNAPVPFSAVFKFSLAVSKRLHKKVYIPKYRLFYPSRNGRKS